MSFPPVPVFPTAIDSDRTLFLVYNTTETKLCVDNAPWSEEIEILAVPADASEIWADNGFGNIEGEMFYYDSVSKNDDGKVYKLKGCARNLAGKKTKFNHKGVWVRSYVVAEHHNQLVDCILNLENFIGYNFDPRQGTLDWRIRNLQALNVIFDDFNCPDVNFMFTVVEDNAETGILTTYSIEITPPGSISSFRLDFGDGEFTTTDLSGTHRYARNARMDPIVTVSNDKCQMIQTPINRDNPAEPNIEDPTIFDIVFPEFPIVPDFTFVPCVVPEPQINLPPMILPCLSLEGQVGPIPSVIIGPDIQMVSMVTIIGGPIDIPSHVIVEGGFSLPSVVTVDFSPIPPTIVIDPPIPPTIVIIPQSNITMQMDFTDLPRLEVDWGTPPEMEVAVTMGRRVKTPTMFAADDGIRNEFGAEFSDLFEAKEHIKVEYEAVGLPSEINVIIPDMPNIMLDASSLPKSIKVETVGANIPEFIKLMGPDKPLPENIFLRWAEGQQMLSDRIEVFNKDVPLEIRAVNAGIPDHIDLRLVGEIPQKIIIEQLTPLPSEITMNGHEFLKELKDILDGGIQVKTPEMPDIKVVFPDVMPTIPVRWEGAPVEVKVTFSDLVTTNEDGKTNCVMIVPCRGN